MAAALLHEEVLLTAKIYQGKSMEEKVDSTLDRLLVEFGKEILAIVPGRVSTEVDARFSFDIQGSINKALHIIEVSMRLFPSIVMPSADMQNSSINRLASTSPVF